MSKEMSKQESQVNVENTVIKDSTKNSTSRVETAQSFEAATKQINREQMQVGQKMNAKQNEKQEKD